MSRRNLRDLKGRAVVGAGGRIFGAVEDLVIDSKTWRIPALVLRVGSKAVVNLGLSKPVWGSARVEIPTELVSAVDDVVILNVTLDQFAERLKTAQPTQSEPPTPDEPRRDRPASPTATA